MLAQPLGQARGAGGKLERLWGALRVSAGTAGKLDVAPSLPGAGGIHPSPARTRRGPRHSGDSAPCRGNFTLRSVLGQWNNVPFPGTP